MKKICECGKEIDASLPYSVNSITRYDDKGNVLIAICPHGVILEDNRKPTVDDLITGNLEHFRLV